jgi:putative ABC transport system permease protein
VVEDFLGDVRFALRWLRRSPGFTAVAIASFAIGIGFNTALFTVVDAVLFRPLPVREPARLVDVFTTSNHDQYATSSYPDFIDLKASNAVFEDMLGFSPMFGALNVGDHSRLVSGEVVTGNYFQMLGVKAAIGRTLDPSDDRPDAARAVMVSEAFWRREMAADPAVVGRQVRLRGLPYTVVGVAPRSFTGMLPIMSPELWVPTSQVEEVSVVGIQHNVPSPTGTTMLERRGSRWMFVKGRLKPGATLEQARANLDVLMRALMAANPQTNKDMAISVLRTADVHVHPDANQLLVAVGSGLMLLVGLVMLVGCANVASMLLARAAGRQREIGIRLAIGASRGRLVRQLLTESLVLASLGAMAGVVLAWWITRAIATVRVPIPIPISVNLPLDGRVLAFTAIVAALAALAAGLMPAIRSSRMDLAGEIRGEAHPSSGRRRRWTLRDALVASQIAVTMVLLVCGGLLAQSLLAARTARLGFRTGGLAILSMDLEMARYDAARSREFFTRALDRARTIPGVDYATLGSTLPFAINFNNMTFFIPGRDQPGRPGTSILETEVGPDYFRMLDIPMVEGRPFIDADTPDKPNVAIVNATMARRFWPGESAIGKVIRIRTEDGAPVQIVGVSADYKVHTVGEAPSPYVHMAYNQRRTTYGSLIVRTRGDAEALLAQLRRSLVALEPNVVFVDNQTMTRQVAATMFPVLAGAWLVGLIALVTMALAGIGLYGVIAYSVARRSREIGIRMALGARPGSILGLVMQQGLIVALVGLALGSMGAVATARFLANALYGVSAIDPTAWAGAATIILAVSALANFVPARRAAAVDPTTALRTE